jgi:hypothetical protein
MNIILRLVRLLIIIVTRNNVSRQDIYVFFIVVIRDIILRLVRLLIIIVTRNNVSRQDIYFFLSLL